jgi:hypothetical protein
VTDRIVGFPAQRAVEKGLKAVLAVHDVEFPFTHDLGALAELSMNSGAALPPELSKVDQPTPFRREPAVWRSGRPGSGCARDRAWLGRADDRLGPQRHRRGRVTRVRGERSG